MRSSHGGAARIFENSMIDALLHREHTPTTERNRPSRAEHTRSNAPHCAHPDEVRQLVRQDRDAAAVPRRGRGARQAASSAISWRYSPTAILTCWKMRARIWHRVRPHHFGGRGRFVQAACRDLPQGGRTAWLAPDAILFVANHAFDCVGAKAYGMPTCFVDRRKRPFGQWPYQPDLIVADFKELAEQLG